MKRNKEGMPSGEPVERWRIWEMEVQGPEKENHFFDSEIWGEFSYRNRALRVRGFYDGNGIYKIRFMPDQVGLWTYIITSAQDPSLLKEGCFVCCEASSTNHGPVHVINNYHFAYEDGTDYRPVGTTCYSWIHQEDSLEEKTLKTLSKSPFNKMRMCVFPKFYDYCRNEPIMYPYEKTPNGEWGFSSMDAPVDDRYLEYLIARLGAYPNVWWSLANEYDLMKSKTEADWERYARIIMENDPYGRLRSIHNCFSFYNHSKPWITHCSMQRQDVYKTAEYTDEWREIYGKPVVIDECGYEGNLNHGWGNLTGEELTRRFWEGAVRGGYVGHGETYLNPEEELWWSKGGELTGSSVPRIAFLRKILEEGPFITPIPFGMRGWDLPCGGVPGEYYLFYFGFNQPSFRQFKLPEGTKYRVDILDTWDMTVSQLEDEYEGEFSIDLPAKQFMAVRMRRVISN